MEVLFKDGEEAVSFATWLHSKRPKKFDVILTVEKDNRIKVKYRKKNDKSSDVKKIITALDILSRH